MENILPQSDESRANTRCASTQVSGLKRWFALLALSAFGQASIPGCADKLPPWEANNNDMSAALADMTQLPDEFVVPPDFIPLDGGIGADADDGGDDGGDGKPDLETSDLSETDASDGSTGFDASLDAPPASDIGRADIAKPDLVSVVDAAEKDLVTGDAADGAQPLIDDDKDGVPVCSEQEMQDWKGGKAVQCDCDDKDPMVNSKLPELCDANPGHSGGEPCNPWADNSFQCQIWVRSAKDNNCNGVRDIDEIDIARNCGFVGFQTVCDKRDDKPNDPATMLNTACCNINLLLGGVYKCTP